MVREHYTHGPPPVALPGALPGRGAAPASIMGSLLSWPTGHARRRENSSLERSPDAAAVRRMRRLCVLYLTESFGFRFPDARRELSAGW